ncbi:MAG: ABC transporter ATP-binding protein [Deltaproteobacteria bacterium]|nr:ABC transporter ATP-binding protein [Deltaproteobacteria bacterium]MBW2154342.1 ABC transporter ATP-binding protein [Deltaproteobacteria bacterium]
MAKNNEPLLTVSDLRTHFYTDEGIVKAVEGVDFDLHKKETLGIVGESGCGKSVTALSIMRLVPEPAGRIVNGEIWFEGRDLTKLTHSDMRQIRGNKISMIFQEPMTSLNPVFTIGYQIAEAIKLHQGFSKKEALEKAVLMLKTVGISSAERRVNEYPHQLSGGMRQRVMIAMALSCNPSLLIADEPTTALDVTIQAQILNLMNKLKQEFEAAIILITHDLGVIAEMAQNVIVMYTGKIVESGDVNVIFEQPLHPYTQGLLGSVPSEEIIINKKKLHEIPGVVPNLTELPAGCPFHPRCSQKMTICTEKTPRLFEPQKGHEVACWLYPPDSVRGPNGSTTNL